MKIFMGMADAAGYTCTVLAFSRARAEKELYTTWRGMVYKGFEPSIKSFRKLSEFNGARVIEVEVDKGFVWEQA